MLTWLPKVEQVKRAFGGPFKGLIERASLNFPMRANASVSLSFVVLCFFHRLPSSSKCELVAIAFTHLSRRGASRI